MKYILRTSARAKKSKGKSLKLVGKKAKLGTGKRFAALKAGLTKKGAKNPGALAAWIGRKNLGKSRFQKLAANARARARKA